MKPGLKSLDHVLQEILNQNPELKVKLHKETLIAAWPSIVGDFVARHTKPLNFNKGGELLIRVLHPMLHTELARMEPIILKKYQERFPENWIPKKIKLVFYLKK